MGNQNTSSFKSKQLHPKHSSPLSKEDSSIPTYQIKPFFPCSIKWRCTNPRDFTYISKLRPKLLSHINFVNHKAKNTGTKALKTLARVVTDAKRSVNLKIKDSELSFKQLRYLINSTNHLKKIEIFSLPSNKASDHQLFESLLRIGRNKNLSELTASSALILLQNPKTLDPIRKQIRQLRKMEHLSVYFPLTWNELTKTRNSLRSLRSINLRSTMNLDFRYFSKFSQCNRLEYLRLDFAESHQTSPQEIQHWNSLFQKTHTLQILTLIKSFRSNQDLENFKLFPECFKSLNQLTTLSLQLRSTGQLIEDHQNTFFLCFFTHLKYLTQLQRLEFTIVGNFLLKDIHIEHLALFLQDLRNLQSLELNLPHLESLSEVVILLAKGLQHLSGLKHLRIKSQNNKNTSISYKAMEVFSNSIAHLQLKSLGFPLFQAEESLFPLCRTLSGFKDLSNLNFDLSAFPPQGFKDFTLALKSLHKLSSISLGIPQLNPANNFQDLSTFLYCFKGMPNLSSLHLTFSGKNLCDQEVDVIARNLNDCCRYLSRLELVFEHAAQLSESSLNSLQAGFANLTKLENLKLEIGSEFDFDVVCKFLAGLAFLKILKELSFECHDFNYAVSTHYPMPEHLQGLYTLKHLTKIVVNNCRYI